MTTTRYVDLRGVENLAEVLRALYNAAKPLGLGWLHYRADPMTTREAEEILAAVEGLPETYFDYLHGRPLKVGISRKRPMRVDLFDRDQGEGAAERALAGIPGWKWCDKGEFEEEKTA